MNRFGTELLSALDCVLRHRRVIYASSPLTSGLRLMQLVEEHHADSRHDLVRRLGREEFERQVLVPNAEAAIGFARRIQKANRSATVISPAPLSISSWGQPEYNEFWSELIRTRVTEVWLNEGWHYSSGCILEFAVAQSRGLKLFDAVGRALTGEEGYRKLEAVRETKVAHLIGEDVWSKVQNLIG